MKEDLRLVVKRKYHQQKQDSGVVEIFFTIDAENLIEPPNTQQFPTKSVWISSGYDEIESRFSEEELFILDSFRPIDSSSDDEESAYSEGRAVHWSGGKSAKKIPSGEFIPVISCDLPDIASGILALPGEAPKDQFFILNEGYVFGPFLASQTESEVVAQPNQCLPLGLSQQHVAKIRLEDLERQNTYLPVAQERWLRETGYISALRDLALLNKSDIEQMDYISNAQLVSFFARNGFGSAGSKLGRKPAEQLKHDILAESKRNQKFAENERMSRLVNVLDDYLADSDSGWPIIDNWLGTQKGKSFLTDLILKHPQVASSHTEELNYEKKRLNDEISQLQVEKRRAESDLNQIKQQVIEERKTADSEIEQIRQQTRQQQQEERERLMADIELKIAEKKNELAETTDMLEAIQNRLDASKSLDELKNEIKRYQDNLDDLKYAVREQENLLKSPTFVNEVVKTDTILGILQGRDFSSKRISKPYVPSTQSSEVPGDGASIVQAIADSFEVAGRPFTFEETANIVVTVQQSFMTVLQGQPGAGKTSTAIRLAQAQNLADATGASDNFLNVPISRGWVSGRDFLGFYNPLKGTYQSAKTGMYEFLLNGKEVSSRQALRFILLDEANLSPIEHYMSDFLGIFDVEGRDRPIDTGIQDSELRYLPVAANIRFIATVNNDNTTEPLSPRLIDRVPIISMDQFSAQSIKSAPPFNLDGAVSYSLMEKFFGVSEIEVDFPTKIQLILDIFAERNKDLGQAITVSKRKQIAIHNYYTAAKNYLDDSVAIDFAVSQYMLPLINGFGKKYRARLEKISEQVSRSNLSRSASQLETILENGDTHVNSYSFF